MPTSTKQIGRILINVLLVIGLVVLLAAYAIIVADLPSRLYTDDQWEYLSYNYGRSITQSGLTVNEMKDEGIIELAPLSVWETDVDATLTARYEEQSGVNITVYDLDYRSEYLLIYPGPNENARVTLVFPFPGNLETLHEVRFLVDGEEPTNAQYTVQGITWEADLTTDREHKIVIDYKADGVNSFTYGLQHNRRTDVSVSLLVEGLNGSQVPQSSLPTTDVAKVKDGQRFEWQYEGLIPNRDIRLNLPTQLSFAQRVAQLQDDFRTLSNWAPILIGLFLASLAILLRFRNMRLAFESYLMIGFALVLFYPTLTFLSGLLDVTLAAILSLAAVSALVITFLGMTLGWRGTWWRVSILLVIYLGIFSLGMLSPWRRLLVTAGGLLLVATFMLAYARRKIPPEQAETKSMVDKPELEVAPAPTREAPAASEPPRAHCPQCGRARGSDYAFCPSCGYDTENLRSCDHCGHEQLLLPETEDFHCLQCGKVLEL